MTEIKEILLRAAKVEPIILSPYEYQILKTWANARSIPMRLVQRVRIIQMAAGGTSNQGIAKN